MKSNRYILGIPGIERAPKDELLSLFFLFAPQHLLNGFLATSEERQQLTEENFLHLMMLYFNSEKLDFIFFNCFVLF